MNYKIRPHFSMIPHNNNFVELRYGSWNAESYFFKDDTQSNKLLPLFRVFLDESGTEQKLLEKEGIKISRSDLEMLLDHLMELGVVQKETGDEIGYSKLFYNSSLGLLSQETSFQGTLRLMGTSEELELLKALLKREDPLLMPVCYDETSEVFKKIQALDSNASELEIAELGESFQSWKGDLVAICFESNDPLFFLNFNRIALWVGFKWIPAFMDGPFIYVGPSFQPKQGACFECLETRVISNLREDLNYIQSKSTRDTLSPSLKKVQYYSSLSAIKIGHLGAELMRWMKDGSCFTRNRIFSIYVPTMEVTYHPILRVPRCRSCGVQTGRDSYELHGTLAQQIKSNTRAVSL